MPPHSKMLIYLVGFMGAGKTSVGVRLAELLGWRFVDLDAEIEECAGEAIRTIFQCKGEAFFRTLEREQLQRASTLDRTVVALGGGAFCGEENRLIVESTGTSVWLDVPIDIIHARCAGDRTRPLFTSLAEMSLLLEKRRPFYEKCNLRIDAGSETVDAIARKVIEFLPIITTHL